MSYGNDESAVLPAMEVMVYIPRVLILACQAAASKPQGNTVHSF